MKKLILGVALIGVALALIVIVKPAEAKKDACATIQNDTILDVNGNTITTGSDQWGYNYQSHMFNGWYWNYSRPDVPWTKETLEAAEMSTTWLIMKWSDEWLSNKDCNGDEKLDRGYSCDPENANSSACVGSWLTNHQRGVNDDGSHWEYFVKIITPDESNDDYKVPTNANGNTIPGMWYTADDEEIGSVVWSAYARILQISNDPAYDEHGVLYNWVTPAGFGFYK